MKSNMMHPFVKRGGKLDSWWLSVHRRSSSPKVSLRTAVLGWALLAGIFLTACTAADSSMKPTASTGQSSSTATHTSTAPSTPSAAPSPTYKAATAAGPAQNVPVPVLPAKAKEFSKEGLEAFARYWYTTLSYVFETGDSKPMMAITDQSCKPCSNINEPVGDWYADGNWILGGIMAVHSATSAFEETTDGTYQVILMSQQSPVSYYTTNGNLDTSYPPTIARADILVAIYSNGHWTTQTAEHLTKE